MIKVVLDPGHFKGHNKGVVAGYYEGTAMFEYAYILAEKLKKNGVTVTVTREKVTDNPSLSARGKKANGADLFLSLHSNAAASSDANGVTVFYSIKRDADKSLAQNWCNKVAALIAGGTRARGACTRKSTKGDWDYYTVIQSAAATNCPHVFLVEHGFHTNKKDCEWIAQKANLEKMADMECSLILDIIGGKKSTSTSNSTSQTVDKKIATMLVNTPGDTLNVRDQSSVAGKILGELAHGSTVDVYEKATNGWMRIEQGKLKGWVNGKYLQEQKETSFLVKVTADSLNIRKGPGTNYDVVGSIKDHGTYTIVEEQNGWGRLKSGAGWISINYTERR